MGNNGELDILAIAFLRRTQCYKDQFYRLRLQIVMDILENK